MSGAWPCGHPRTPENTQSVGIAGTRCRECRRKIVRESAKRMRNSEAYRRRVLPQQLNAARKKVEMLANEARRYGMTELLEGLGG